MIVKVKDKDTFIVSSIDSRDYDVEFKYNQKTGDLIWKWIK